MPRRTHARSARTGRTTALTVLAGAALVVSVAPAGAMPSVPEGLWYVEDLGLTTAHQSATGEGITVAVLDTVINPDVPELAGADLVVPEDSLCPELLTEAEGDMVPSVSTSGRALHGTQMTMLVAGDGTGRAGAPGVQGIAPGATVRHYAISYGGDGGCVGEDNVAALATGIEAAVADGADVISISSGEEHETRPEQALVDSAAAALRAGAIIVTATPNSGSTTRVGFPAELNGVVTVSAYGPDGELVPGRSSAHPTLDVVAPGDTILAPDPDDDWRPTKVTSGSSNATAITAGALALVWSLHPDATANQIIQTLVRNTESAGGELARHDDWWGYGKLSIARMLAADPLTYPDENPLLVDEPAAVPSFEEVVGEGEPSDDAPQDPDQVGPQDDATQEPDGQAAPRVPMMIAGALLLAVVVATVTFVVLRRSRADHARKSQEGEH